MTPKEKAKELINKFSGKLPFYSEKDNLNKSKQCALIAVQEIINSNPHSNPLNTEVSSTMEFWQKVKTEIKKL